MPLRLRVATARVSWFAATVTVTSLRVACTEAMRISSPLPVVVGVVVVVGAVVVAAVVEVEVVDAPVVVEVEVVPPVTVNVPCIVAACTSQWNL